MGCRRPRVSSVTFPFPVFLVEVADRLGRNGPRERCDHHSRHQAGHVLLPAAAAAASVPSLRAPAPARALAPRFSRLLPARRPLHAPRRGLRRRPPSRPRGRLRPSAGACAPTAGGGHGGAPARSSSTVAAAVSGGRWPPAVAAVAGRRRAGPARCAFVATAAAAAAAVPACMPISRRGGVSIPGRPARERRRARPRSHAAAAAASVGAGSRRSHTRRASGGTAGTSWGNTFVAGVSDVGLRPGAGEAVVAAAAAAASVAPTGGRRGAAVRALGFASLPRTLPLLRVAAPAFVAAASPLAPAVTRPGNLLVEVGHGPRSNLVRGPSGPGEG